MWFRCWWMNGQTKERGSLQVGYVEQVGGARTWVSASREKCSTTRSFGVGKIHCRNGQLALRSLWAQVGVLSWGGGVFHGFIMVHHNPNHLHQPTIKFAGFLPIIFLPLPAPPKRKMFFSFPISTELRAHSSKPLKAVLINNQNHFAIVP